MSTHLDDAKAQALVDCCLPERERCACEEHLACCPECTFLVDSYHALGEALEDLDAPTPPADFTGAVMCCIEEAERAHVWERRVSGAILGVALVTCLVLFGAAGVGDWTAGLSALASGVGHLARAFDVAGDILSPIVSAFRTQIVVACCAAAVPLFVAMWRLSPRHDEVVA